MRTDVKVGLVCVLALVVAVITYFALEGKTKEPAQTADNRSANVAEHNKDAAPAGPATPADPTAVNGTPPATPAIVTPPAAYSQAPTGQVSPPPAPADAPAPSGPRTLLPPTSPTPPAVPPLSNDPTATAPATPSLIGPADRLGEPEHPSLHRDSLIETHPVPTHSLDTPDAPIAPAGTSNYTVVNGDNLTNIAKKNHTTVTALKAANPTINPDKLRINQVIILPAPGTGVPTTRPAHTAATRPGHTATTRPGHSATTHPAHPATTRPAHVAAGNYTVKKGDTLRKIAKSVYGDEKLWRRIFRANRGDLTNPNAITPGMVLKIPSR